MHKYHKSCFYAYLTVLTTCYNMYDLKLSENSYLHHFSAQVSQIVFLAYLIRFRSLLQMYDLKCEKTHNSTSSFHKYHKSCSSLIWPFYSLLQPFYLEYRKTHICTIAQVSQISAQVSQSVFLAYLTVLRLITTVWPEMSEFSYLRHFSALVSQIVFLAYLTVLRLITTVWPEISKNSSPTFQCTKITNRVLTLFDRSTTYYNTMT